MCRYRLVLPNKGAKGETTLEGAVAPGEGTDTEAGDTEVVVVVVEAVVAIEDVS